MRSPIQASARRWRMTGSVAAPLALAASITCVSSLSNANCWPSVEAPRSNASVPSRPSSRRRPRRRRGRPAVRAPSKNTSANSEVPVICRIGTHLDAGLPHRHEQVREALVLRRLRVGAAEDEAPVGDARERRPDLLAGDDPLVAVALGAALHAAEVGAGVRLGVALAPELLGAEDRRQEAALLLLGAEARSASGRAASRRCGRAVPGRARARTPR